MLEPPDDNILVKIRAQVMVRDDSTGGWVPMNGGGLAIVSVIRRPVVFLGASTPDIKSATLISDTNNQDSALCNSSPSSKLRTPCEYIICGFTTTENTEILKCVIERNFEYNKVMPTFHHWRTGEERYGLTFQTAADARSFDRGVRTAVEELFDGFAEQSVPPDEKTNLDEKSIPDEKSKTDAGEDDVFMSVNLPVELPEPPRPSPAAALTVSTVTTTGTTTTTTSTTDTTTQPRHDAAVRTYRSQCSDLLDPHRPPVHYRSGSGGGGGTNGPSIIKMPPHPLQADLASDNYPYVQLTSLNHEYLYPMIDEQRQQQKLDKVKRSNSASSLKKPDIIVSQPTKEVDGMTMKGGRENLRLRCKHCQELFTEQQNPRGACEYAPDPVRSGIAKVSCLSCAQCMLYHCMSDAEGDFTQNPCSCSAEDGCGRRWFGLALLSLIVPCLWMYPPLRALHWCGVVCGVCGARHRAAD